MKKQIKILIISIMIIITVGLCTVSVRNHRYQTGKNQGYLSGFSIGYADSLQGIRQDSQILSGELVPYEYGNSLWKGFMMGFTAGYDDGMEHGNGVK